MRFRTEIALAPCPARLSPQTRVVLAGSCFAEHIGERLSRCFPGSRLCVNPRGTLYNPASIHALVYALAHPERENLREGLFEADDGLWHHWDCSTKFTAPTSRELLARLQESHAAAQTVFAQAGFLFITFSTDRVYLLSGGAADGRPVGNCHKQPASCFSEQTLCPEETFRKWDDLLKELHRSRPALHVVFTLSPYRYAKYGMHGNALAKARLLLLIDRLCGANPNAAYFPAYEIVLDELRDYRFYDTDMLHPSAQAVDYVWERFADWCFTPELKAYGAERECIVRAMAHRALNPGSKAHESFRTGLQASIDRFERKWGETIDGSPILP